MGIRKKINNASVEAAVRRNCIDEQQAGRIMRFYRQGLEGYTYLEGSQDMG